MKKVSIYKCPTCNMKYRTLDAWNLHTLEMHKDKIPEGFTPSRYFYLILTGKGLDGPYCPVCHKPNPWNENTLKYAKYCGDELCRKELARQAKQNMMKKYGKEHLMNDPEYQKNLLKHRRISGTYKFKDGHDFDYTGSYEKDFLKMLDTFMQWPSGDLISPSPNIYKYIYDGQEHFYIPDFFIPSLKLEIEIKDGGDNPNMHHKIQAVDKVKEKNKDETVMNTSGVNYIKLVNKEYHDFFEYLLKVKEEGIVLEANTSFIEESVMTACAPIVPYQGVIVKPGMEPDHFAKGFKKKKKSKITDDFTKSYDNLIDDIKVTINTALGTTPVNSVRLTSFNKNRYLSRARSLRDISISDDNEDVYLIYNDDDTLGYFSISRDDKKYIKKIHTVPKNNDKKEDSFKELIRVATNTYNAKGIIVPPRNRVLISMLEANGFNYVEETPNGVLMER